MPPGMYIERILSRWEQDEEQDALVCGPMRLTRGQARRRLFQLGHALRGQGLAPGDGVGLFLTNRAESALLVLAVHMIGCRAVMLPPEPGPGELAALIDQSGARIVVADPAYAQQALHAAERCTRAPTLLSLGASDEPFADTDVLALAAQCPAERPEPAPEPGPSDAVTVFYTGGTLGRPKLAAHGRLPYDVIAAVTEAAREPQPAGGDRVLVVTLLTHTSGHLTMLAALMTGSPLVVLPEWDADAAFTALREEEITTVFTVPPMLYQLLDHPDCERGALPALRQISLGAAPIAPHRLRQAVETFGPVIAQGYGQTECAGITFLPAEELPEPGDIDSARWRSCGRPFPGTQLEIRAQDGEVLPQGQAGEVCVLSPARMLGYWQDPERTAEAVDAAGWLRTGDIGYLDADGYLYLVDRAKDVIVTGEASGNVYSKVLEDFLHTLPGVRHAAAVGVPDEALGERVRIYLAGEGIDIDAVADLVTAELGPNYTPHDTVLLPALPTTRVGKVDKKALRASEEPALQR
ncbi:AMP-binding protein [Saccharopolyspora sp. NFXS83]|uniref:class I adenylate-forming enzyme family protein n=1 Tax=Saccharopolyspora sp. NFXS83 TaxID=2993560 RepID=UPI00224B9789|nr:AMP-binding protein [Saccharopolyspora sp. NFXS83]MCX2732641.1 AMP-binding protein [Saccharopolyspora sp. NFXS83]